MNYSWCSQNYVALASGLWFWWWWWCWWLHIPYEDYLLAVVKSPGSTKFPVDLASAVRAANATNAVSPGTKVKAKG